MHNNEPGFCKEECFYSNQGHCSATRYEYYTHCEKLYWSGLRQRGYPNEPRNAMEEKFTSTNTGSLQLLHKKFLDVHGDCLDAESRLAVSLFVLFVQQQQAGA